MIGDEHRGWWMHHHARHVEGCHWCAVDDSQPPIEDTPWVYGPREESWFDDRGAYHYGNRGPRLLFGEPITAERLAAIVPNPFAGEVAGGE